MSGSKLSLGHKQQIHLQSWASTQNQTLHLIPAWILSWSPQHSMPALGPLWDFPALSQSSPELLHCTKSFLPILEACPSLLSCIFTLEAALTGSFGLLARFPNNQQVPGLSQPMQRDKSHCQKPPQSRGREGQGSLPPSTPKVLWVMKEGLR